MSLIIDTNVPIIANGNKSEQASLECRHKCTQLIIEIKDHAKYKLVLDFKQKIIEEYKRHLVRNRGGVGDQFLTWVLTYLWTDRCTLVRITEDGDSFVEFPNDDERLQKFDPADRKWIAVALAHKRDHGDVPPITQAADMKWKPFESAFQDHEITIDFICDPD